jgi:DHA2 family multidrug resistance protein
MSPRSIGTMFSMLIVGRLMGRVDSRMLIAVGLLLTAFSMWQMTQYSLLVDTWSIVLPGLIMGFGIGTAMVPATTISFATLASGMRNEATALYALVRNLGNSVGISVVQGLLAHNMQVAHASLAEHITPYSRALPQLAGAAGGKAVQMLNQQVSAQAAMLAYVDDFRLLMMVGLVAIPFLLFVRVPRIKPGVPDVVVE